MAKKKAEEVLHDNYLGLKRLHRGWRCPRPTSQPLGRHQVQQSALCLFNFYFSFFCDLQFFATGWAANGV